MKGIIFKGIIGVITYLVWQNLGGTYYESAIIGAFVFLVLLANPLHNPGKLREEKVSEAMKRNIERMKNIHEQTSEERKIISEQKMHREEQKSKKIGKKS